MLLISVASTPASESAVETAPATAVAASMLTSTSPYVLSDVQVSNLRRLAKVWGFLKYHHPVFTGGREDADAALLQMLQQTMNATDSVHANAIMVEWIKAMGPIESCGPCASESSENWALRPRLQWLSDVLDLGVLLSEQLRLVHRHRRPGQQHYVSLSPNARNPVFENERAYPAEARGELQMRLLSVMRFWNIVEYWSPYRDLIDEDWDQVLTDSLRRITSAQDENRYVLELMAMFARVDDTHTNLWSAINARPPAGECQLPVAVRFVEGQAAVTAQVSGAAREDRIRVGDVISSIDGVALAQRSRQWLPYYAGSNDASRYRDIGRFLSRGRCGATKLEIQRAGVTKSVTVSRVPTTSLDLRRAFANDLDGPTFRLLTPQIAYLKASSLRSGDVAAYFSEASATRGLVIDLRGYPTEFVLLALASQIVDEPKAIAKFTVPELSNPGAFVWKDGPLVAPAQPHYSGKVVVLVDESTQSQAEYTAMALRAAPNTVIVGSTTAGADGNMSRFALPGGLTAAISGIGVFYPDKTPTQRAGIVADVAASPTIHGVADGRDEVLEAGLRAIAGTELTEADLQAISRLAGKRGM
jgi:C-terminal processing protease CtpA/Prc